MKSLAIGRDDFKHIIENDSYYIDKTKFIEEILKDTSMVKLITSFLYKHYTKKVILLIDEYDIPLIEVFKNGYYEEASTFLVV